MADFYKGIPVIDTDTPTGRDVLHPSDATFGMVPRNYDEYPEAMFAAPSEMDVVPESEWDARYDEQERTQSSLEHIYLKADGTPKFTCLDQNGHGYCWAYSTVHAVMLARLRDNQPLVRLNPHSVAAIIKGGRDEGAWSGLSAKFVREYGVAEEGTGPNQWPLHSRNVRLDTPELRQAMAKYKIDEDWYDLTRREWNQTLTSRQLATCGFMNIPAPSDFNWWGHAVCQVRWVRIERGSWGPLILNSWRGWGRHGLAVLRGSQAIANGAVAVRTALAA